MTPIIISHVQLGAIRCLRDPKTPLINILGLPYATIPRRFARAEPLISLNKSPRYKDDIFDATIPGPSSIQPYHSVTDDASNIPLPTSNLPDDEEQAEDCLNLSIRLPSQCFDTSSNLRSKRKLPVLVFIHGGAFFLGSTNRPYYDPTNLLSHSIQRSTPFIFVGVNYRLGILGFLHSPHSEGKLPENNGLYDQNLALQWVKRHIDGFGGDAENITVIGQSAGGESVALKTMGRTVFKRAKAFSGTPVTMPALTPEEHHENFVQQARALGIRSTYGVGEERSAGDIAEDMLKIPVDQIRDLTWVGLPCAPSPSFPMDKPSMKSIRNGELIPGPPHTPIEAQLISTTTYDGSISYNMLSRDTSRANHAQTFIKIAEDVLTAAQAKLLCKIYGVTPDTEDSSALQRICLFESDIGFFAAALATAEAGFAGKTYFQSFDLSNPFPGPLREKGAFAAHTFDIVTLLGGVHEDLLPESYGPVIRAWRDVVLDFVCKGKAPCTEFGVGDGDGGRKGLVVDGEGLREVGEEVWLRCDEGRRGRLYELARGVDGGNGCDVLWVEVCRRFLMKGE